jgi:hypothetical protein
MRGTARVARGLPGQAQPAQGGLPGVRFDPQQGLMGEGGQTGLPAFPQRGGGKGRVALPAQGLEQGVIRMMGLEHHPPGPLRPAGAAGDLDHQLGHALRGPEVGAIEAVVRIQDADQGDAGKVVTLGQHLGAHQEGIVPGEGRRQQPVQLALATGAVAIHPGDANVREQGLQLPRETLGTLAQGPDIEPPALGAGGGGWAGSGRSGGTRAGCPPGGGSAGRRSGGSRPPSHRRGRSAPARNRAG